jgi:hypothetical protein
VLPCVSRNGGQLAFAGYGQDATTTALLVAYADVLQHGHDFENAERAVDHVLMSDRCMLKPA